MSGRRRLSARPAPAGGQDPKRMRSEVIPCSGADKKGSSSAPAIVRDLTVDERVLECRVCYLPLKPPIFQCGVGHVLCSPCSEKLRHARNCHLCGVAMPGRYQRCHAMEDVMDSIRGPCPHAPYGCDTTPAYHAREEHILECPHAPCHCHCPGDACGFVGSATALVEHLAAAHSWPCTAEPCADGSFVVDLRDGFNFLTAVRGGTKYLLLLDMASTRFFHVISASWIRSVPAMASNSLALPATVDLELGFTNMRSQFQLQCTPPNAAIHPFFFPKYPGRSDKAIVHVTAVISIYSS